MKILLKLFFLECAALTAFPQANHVNLAAIAMEKGHYDNAWENANAALQSPQLLNSELLYKAHSIRGKAGARIAYLAFTKGTDEDMQKYQEMPMLSYLDFKEILSAGDSVMTADITPEFYKLGHALYMSGTEYDRRNADNEKPDTLLLNKSIECYTATIEMQALAKKEKYKPYFYRGDAQLTKRKYDLAVQDFKAAMDMYAAAIRQMPDLGIGDLGYRLAYTQAGVFNQKEVALKTIQKTRELLKTEMQLAETKKEKLAEIYVDIQTEFDYLTGELENLETSVKNESVQGAPVK